MNEQEYGKAVAFDRFCKKVMKNETKDFYSEINSRQEHEVLYSEMTEQELNGLYSYDTYSSDYDVFTVLDFDIIIRDPMLAKALSALSDKKRNIILLHFYVGYTDKEIGEILSLMRATVQYNRNSGLNFLRRYIKDIKEKGASP